MKQNTQQSGRAIHAKRHKILSFKIKDVKIAGIDKTPQKPQMKTRNKCEDSTQCDQDESSFYSSNLINSTQPGEHNL